ncbi:hypothetical protein ACQPXT_41005 (plasmid) [Streptomyces sp. CA-100214]
MLKTWREEYRANQALKRKIALEQWEQEKRWREEDRAARLKVIAENAPALAAHNEHIRTATGVSYLTLVCHEDTWTFMAVRAFGQWKPYWTKVRSRSSRLVTHRRGTRWGSSPSTRTCQKAASRSSAPAHLATASSRYCSPV